MNSHLCLIFVTKLAKAGNDERVRQASIINHECECFELSIMAEDQFKHLAFVCSPRSPEDADIKVRILSQIEVSKHSFSKGLSI